MTYLKRHDGSLGRITDPESLCPCCGEPAESWTRVSDAAFYESCKKLGLTKDNCISVCKKCWLTWKRIRRAMAEAS